MMQNVKTCHQIVHFPWTVVFVARTSEPHLSNPAIQATGGSIPVKSARILIILLFLSALSIAQQSDSDAAKLPGIDGFAGQLLKESNVPGLGMGIVQDGTVVMARDMGADWGHRDGLCPDRLHH
jgi:hypothetical protein